MDDPNIKPKIVSLKCLTDGHCLTFKGPGEFRIGLTAEDKVKYGRIDNGEEDNEIIVPLMQMTLWKTSGTTISPGNRDLPCLVNGEKVTSETNLIPGSVIEIGDKRLEFFDGPIVQPRRRHLPPTPGVPILPQPPPKPYRTNDENIQKDGIGPVLTKGHMPLSESELPPLLDDWALIELPNSEAELIQQAKTPEQLAGLAAGYVTKHIHIHTDARVTTELADQIFNLMQEVASHRRTILQTFLTGLIEKHATSSSDSDKPQGPDHTSIINLMKEILQEYLDPVSLVEVSLLLLRALSHVKGAAQLLVLCQATNAILGSMAALKCHVSVQQYCLDILAKIALYSPLISGKPPLRESAIDLICRTMGTHPKSLTIAQAGCRVLANLATTLYTVSTNSMDSASVASEELCHFVSNLVSLLGYLFDNCLKQIQETLALFPEDLTIKTDGRRFMFVYAKQEQLRQRKEQWLSSASILPCVDTAVYDDLLNEQSEMELQGPGRGIMKRSRSFENLRTPERKVKFGENDTSESSTSSSSPSPTQGNEELAKVNREPVEILSQQLIEISPVSQDSPITSPLSVTVVGFDEPDLAQDSKFGNQVAPEGPCCHLETKINYENWDILRGILRGKASLEGHSYSSGDIRFMTRLTKAQILERVCAHAVDSKDREALNLVELPLITILQAEEVPPGIRHFVERQYQREITLMDLDPGLMVNIIDAVRYKSLAFEMAQKSFLGIVKALDDEQQPPVIAVAVEFLAGAITNRPLSPAMTSELFIKQVCQQLEKSIRVSQNRVALESLLNEIQLCAKM